MEILTYHFDLHSDYIVTWLVIGASFILMPNHCGIRWAFFSCLRMYFCFCWFFGNFFALLISLYELPVHPLTVMVQESTRYIGTVSHCFISSDSFSRLFFLSQIQPRALRQYGLQIGLLWLWNECGVAGQRATMHCCVILSQRCHSPKNAASGCMRSPRVYDFKSERNYRVWRRI